MSAQKKNDNKTIKGNMKRHDVMKQFKFNNHGRNIKETDIIDELSIPDESNFMEKAS